MASKRLLIMQAVIAALEGITKSNGYNNDIGRVYRGLKFLEEVTNDRMPCICLAGMREKRVNSTKREFRSTITLFLVGYVTLPDATDSLQTTLDNFIEDVTKAIEVDRTFNNLTFWNEIQTIETDRGDLEKNGAFTMEVALNYGSVGTTP